MSEWHSPNVQDCKEIYEITNSVNSMASDTSFGNILLLRDKYSTEICFCNGFMLRYYNGKNTRKGYTFPLGNGNLENTLEIIKANARQNNRPFDFILLTEEQRDTLEKVYPDRFEYTVNEGDFDYVYSKKALSELSGNEYHKKKNRYLKFTREYSDYRFEFLTNENKNDALLVARTWLSEYSGESIEDVKGELKSIEYALENFDTLGFSGGILYAGNIAVGMTIASMISENTVDIHFEKAIGEAAKAGAYAAINKLFCEKLPQNVTFVNREEDMNIPGLRKAKRAYHPDILLKKYYAREKTE